MEQNHLLKDERIRNTAPELLIALVELLGGSDSDDNDSNGHCKHCGRELPIFNDETHPFCTSEDCPGFRARAAVCNAEGGE